MSLLPQPATISYNGVVFGDPSTETVSMEATPKYDAAERTVVYIVYKITVRTFVGIDNLRDPTQTVPVPFNPAVVSTDNFFVAVRKRLTTPGGEFHYENNGFGPLVVNVQFQDRAASSGQPRDVVWGPKPRLVKFVPQGTPFGAFLEWTVEVALPECDNAKFYGANNWMEFNYGVDYSIDKSGYTTRTVTGFVRVPQSKRFVNERFIEFSADEARDRLYPDLVPGFRRIPGDYKLSLDKCRLDFTIKDEEVGPNFLPPYTIDASASHTATSGSIFGGLWTGTISATYEITKTVNRSIAMAHFVKLVTERLRAADELPFRPRRGFLQRIRDFVDKDQEVLKQIGKQFVLIRRLTVGEPEIYGRKGASFTAQYTFLSSMDDIAQASGLWRPVGGNDWAGWSTSLLKSGAWGSRGHAGLRFAASDDVIIDLCLPSQSSAGRGRTAGEGKAKPGPKQQPIPPHKTSWMYYVAWLTFEPIDEVVELKPLPSFIGGNKQAVPPPVPPSRGDGGQGVFQPQENIILRIKGFRPDPDPVIQRRAAPTRVVYFHGAAMRAGHQIPEPILRRIGTSKPIPANRQGNGFATGMIASWFGVPIYGAVWNLRYLISEKDVGGIRVPASPFEGF